METQKALVLLRDYIDSDTLLIIDGIKYTKDNYKTHPANNIELVLTYQSHDCVVYTGVHYFTEEDVLYLGDGEPYYEDDDHHDMGLRHYLNMLDYLDGIFNNNAKIIAKVKKIFVAYEKRWMMLNDEMESIICE